MLKKVLLPLGWIGFLRLQISRLLERLDDNGVARKTRRIVRRAEQGLPDAAAYLNYFSPNFNYVVSLHNQTQTVSLKNNIYRYKRKIAELLFSYSNNFTPFIMPFYIIKIS